MSRAALVTGAGRRIGAVVAAELAQAGFDVAVHYGRSAEDARRTAEMVEAFGRRAVLLEADLTSPAEVQDLVLFLVTFTGPLRPDRISVYGIPLSSGRVTRDPWLPGPGVHTSGIVSCSCHTTRPGNHG